MSTQTPSDSSTKLDRLYGGVRFRPRDAPPERLHGPPHVNYPSSDGRPMADNTLQFEWIARIKGGLDVVFRDRPDVFVAGNILWYPVKGNNRRRLAPDALVAFGRPKGYRGSYIQHREGGIAPQVMFEVLSPCNGLRVMRYKRSIYERYGIEEYYEFNPQKLTLEGWLRDGETLQPIPEMSGWVSPRLGIRFELAEDLTIYGPDGRPFEDSVDLSRERDESNQIAREAEDRADLERVRADDERVRADAEQTRADAERTRADLLAAKLRALGLDPDA